MAALRRCCSFVGRSSLDFLVEEFSCRDYGGVRQALGSHCKVSTWELLVSGRQEPIEIVLTVRRPILGAPEVGLTVDGHCHFPVQPELEHEVLKADLSHRWTFDAAVAGLNEPERFEVRAPAGVDGAGRQWCAARLTRQREDGHFDATVRMPDDCGKIHEVALSAIPSRDIRDARTQQLLRLPRRRIDLKVPSDDPLRATFRVDGRELITHYYGRQTPSKSITLRVDTETARVTSSAGHSVLSHFLSKEVRRVWHHADKTKAQWKIQLGPFVEHLIEVERPEKRSKNLVLSVDGRPLVDSSAEDIDCGEGGLWHTDFRFVGAYRLNFEVRGASPSGAAASQLSRFSCECSVTVEDEANLATAVLAAGGDEFWDLAPKEERLCPEPPLAVSVQQLYQDYGVEVPAVGAGRTHSPLAGFGLGALLSCCQPDKATLASLLDASEMMFTSAGVLRSAGA